MNSSKIALVTGGSRGIGAATCRALAKQGWFVWINYCNSPKKAQALAEEIDGQAIQADLRSAEAIHNMLQTIGSIDLVVNNAGIWYPGQVQDIPDSQWEDLFTVNMQGAFRICREVVPVMLSKKQGNIINISSMWGLTGASCESAYSASKGALINFTKSLAKELGPSGIRVNCVCPGVIDTDMCAGYDEETRKALADETPLGRLGQPEDVAKLVAFLASLEADFITGQIIACDGGFTL